MRDSILWYKVESKVVKGVTFFCFPDKVILSPVRHPPILYMCNQVHLSTILLGNEARYAGSKKKTVPRRKIRQTVKSGEDETT